MKLSCRSQRVIEEKDAGALAAARAVASPGRKGNTAGRLPAANCANAYPVPLHQQHPVFSTINLQTNFTHIKNRLLTLGNAPGKLMSCGCSSWVEWRALLGPSLALLGLLRERTAKDSCNTTINSGLRRSWRSSRVRHRSKHLRLGVAVVWSTVLHRSIVFVL